LNNVSSVLDILFLWQEDLLDENDDDSEYEADDGYVDSDDTSLSRRTMVEDKETGPKALSYEIKNQTRPSSIFSPLDSPRTPSPKIAFPKQDKHRKKEPILRLLSTRITDRTFATSLPASPHIRSDSSISSVESDSEAAIVSFRFEIH
jgi:hypothetical protein